MQAKHLKRFGEKSFSLNSTHSTSTELNGESLKNTTIKQNARSKIEKLKVNFLLQVHSKQNMV